MTAKQKRPGKAARGKRKTIAEKERPRGYDNSAMPAELAALIVGDEGRGILPNNPADIGWGGGSEEIDEEAVLAEVIKVETLKEILLALIDSHSGGAKGNDRNKVKTDRQFRLESALHALIGTPAPRGRARNDVEAAADRAAEAYFAQVFGLASKTRALRDILIKAKWPKRIPRADSSQDLDNKYSDLKRYFKKHKHELLVKYAFQNSIDFEHGRRSAERVVSELRLLGLVKESR
jgi:hypothetical protein